MKVTKSRLKPLHGFRSQKRLSKVKRSPLRTLKKKNNQINTSNKSFSSKPIGIKKSIKSGKLASIVSPSTVSSKDNIKEIIESLIKLKFKAFLENENNSVDNVHQRLTIVSKILAWTYYYVTKRQLKGRYISIMKWTKLLFKHGSILNDYQQHIKNVKKHSPLTICTNLYGLKIYIKWCYLFSDAFQNQIHREDYDRFNSTIEAICKSNKSSARKVISKTHNVQEMINVLKFPPGGLKQLQDIIVEEVEWVDQFKYNTSIIDESTYKKFIGILIASIYCFAPQGRISALESMQYKDVSQLLSSYVMSTVFKTQSKYGYQPVYLPSVSKNILKVYDCYYYCFYYCF